MVQRSVAEVEHTPLRSCFCLEGRLGAADRYGGGGGAADGGEFCFVALHFFVVLQGGEEVFKQARGVRVRGAVKAVVHPFAVAAAAYQVGSFEVGEVAGDLRVVGAERFSEEADADLAFGH